jgi:uncharacterized membrane protein YcaP (DUF421 family)
MVPDVAELGLQAAQALGYYAGLIVVVRLLGKRLAGQTTTFDLLVMITLGVVLQTTALQRGTANAFVFVATVLVAHRLLARACARWDGLRHFVRGAPRALVRDGRVLDHALREEGMSRDDLLAALRKLGHASADDVKLAVLEETGLVSAVASAPPPEEAPT